MPRPHLLQIGPRVHREFQPLCVEIAAWSDRGDVRLERINPDDLGARLTDVGPDVAVFCQSTPDEWSPGEVDEVIGAWPLTRILCCYGSWCDSDGRTRSTWPFALRVPVAQAAAQLQRELRALASGQCAAPPTASREEAFAWFYAESPSESPPASARARVEVLVVTPDRAYAEALCALCTAEGWPVRWIAPPLLPTSPPGSDASRVVLWDVDPLPRDSSGLARSMTSVKERTSAAAVVALTGFPRAEVTERLSAAGARAVVPKLAPAATLRECLLNITRDPADQD
jgi:hypothetical protein